MSNEKEYRELLVKQYMHLFKYDTVLFEKSIMIISIIATTIMMSILFWQTPELLCSQLVMSLMTTWNITMVNYNIPIIDTYEHFENIEDVLVDMSESVGKTYSKMQRHFVIYGIYQLLVILLYFIKFA